MKKFNKNSAIRKINLQQNKSTYIKRISIVLVCFILLVGIIMYTFAKFQTNSEEYELINGQVKNFSPVNLQIKRNESEIHHRNLNYENGPITYDYSLSEVNYANATNISCNNDANVTIENNTLKISNITTNTICKINDSIKSTIDNLDNTKNNIKMIKNEDNVERTEVALNKEATLDLNGKEIKSIGVNETSTTYNGEHNVFTVQGKLTINDVSNMGGIFTGKTCRALDTYTNGNLTVNGGRYNGRQSVYVSGSNSTTVINGGVFDSNVYESVAISDTNGNNTLTINGGQFGCNRFCLYVKSPSTSKIFLNNVNFASTDTSAIYTETNNQSTIEINGGHYTTVDKVVLSHNSGTVIIKSGFFESTNSNTISNRENGIMIFDGSNATFENNNYKSGIYVHANRAFPAFFNFGNATIKGGTFYQTLLEGNCNSPVWSVGTLKIFNGIFTGEGGSAVTSNGGTVYLLNGTYNGMISSSIYENRTGSKINICGGTYTSAANNYNLASADSTSVIKYKSSVTWVGRTSPTISPTANLGAFTLDNSITCPNS